MSRLDSHFFFHFVTSMILFRTLLNRNLWLNPLSDVIGGWGIWETVNGEQKLTTECIENVIMMVPFTSMVMWTFQEKVSSGWRKILWYSGKIAFIFSVSIEILQLLLRLGTFQLSDIFYNTVGGNIENPAFCMRVCLQTTGFYGRIIIGYLYPIIIKDFLFGWRDSYVPEI